MNEIRPSMAGAPVVYTVAQVSEILQISPRTVRTLTSRGDLPFRRLTGECRNASYTAEDIQAYLDSCRRVGRGKFTSDPSIIAGSGAPNATNSGQPERSAKVVPMPRTRSRT